jgi:hypothetical protein
LKGRGIIVAMTLFMALALASVGCIKHQSTTALSGVTSTPVTTAKQSTVASSTTKTTTAPVSTTQTPTTSGSAIQMPTSTAPLVTITDTSAGMGF